MLTSDRDDVAAELGWVGLGHGDILPAETNLHRSRVNQTGAAPIGAGMFAIGILGRLFVLRHRHTTSQTESNDPGGSRFDCPHGSDLG